VAPLAISVAPLALALLQGAGAQAAPRASAKPAYPFEIVPEDAIRGHLSEGEFREPLGVCFEAEAREIYVADSKNARIGIFDEDLTPLFSFGGGPVLLEPRAVHAEADGTMLVLDADRSLLRRFNYRGEPMEPVRFLAPPAAQGAESVPLSIVAFAPDGRGGWIVADQRENRVWRFDRELRRVAELQPPIGAASFGAVSDVAVSRDGLVAVSDQRGVRLTESLRSPSIHVYDAAGKLIAAFGERDIGLDNFTAAAAVAFDEHGFLFAVDSLRHDVKIFTPSGAFVGRFGGWFSPQTRGRAPGEMRYPSDVAIAPGGPILVAERFGHRVQVFRRKPLGAAEPAAPSEE
jgi:DNA-binding beta-propeller fold protein YncE